MGYTPRAGMANSRIKARSREEVSTPPAAPNDREPGIN